jgi:hypothetical protein
MQILAETGCYADFTLPSAPDQSQVPKINAIYECGAPLSEPVPHRSGVNLKVGRPFNGPMIFTGPLVFDWSRRIRGLPVPRIDGGALAQNQPLTFERFERWRKASIGVVGLPQWVFIKLYSHAFFTWDQDCMIGEQMRRFMSELLELADRTRDWKIHFASCREAYNMVVAAVEGKTGDPHQFRDYRLKQIMSEPIRRQTEPSRDASLVVA